MTRLEIAVPNMNDSFSKVVLDGKVYLIRFTWNLEAQRWSFGLYTIQKEPIAVGIKIIPNFPLNLQVMVENFPTGVLGVYTSLESVERDDFLSGKAVFAYISAV